MSKKFYALIRGKKKQRNIEFDYYFYFEKNKKIKNLIQPRCYI